MVIYLNYLLIAVAAVCAAPHKSHTGDHGSPQSVERTYEYYSGIIPKDQAAHWEDRFPTGGAGRSGVYEREYVSVEYVKYDKNGNVIFEDFQSDEYLNGKKIAENGKPIKHKHHGH